MCLLVWRILAYCNPRNILIRARHIQGCLNVLQEGQNNSNRMVPSSSDIQLNLQSLAQTNGGHVYHQIESQATNLCLPVPDANAMNIDAVNISWEGLDGYAFCPLALIPKVIQKMNTYRCNMIVVAPGWPRMHWFWDLVNLSTKPPL